MIKKKSTLPINLLSAFVILLCVFMSIISPSNAWFKDSQDKGIQITVKVGDLKLSLYHTSVTSSNLLYTDKVNNENETDNDNTTTTSYIPLSGKIEADKPVALKLILSNEASDSIPMFVRFKFELYSRGIDEDTLIETELTGMGNPEDLIASDNPELSSDTLVLDNSAAGQGFYYLQNSSNKEVVLGKNKKLTLFTHFTIPKSEFIANGVSGLTNSDELYIKLYVDSSLTAYRTQSN